MYSILLMNRSSRPVCILWSQHQVKSLVLTASTGNLECVTLPKCVYGHVGKHVPSSPSSCAYSFHQSVSKKPFIPSPPHPTQFTPPTPALVRLEHIIHQEANNVWPFKLCPEVGRCRTSDECCPGNNLGPRYITGR